MENKRKSFSRIYDKYIDKIYRFVFLRVNSVETAEDLTSETFVRLWDSLRGEKDIENPQAFIYKIARNLTIDFYRNKHKLNVVSTSSVKIIDPRIDLEEKANLNSELEQVKKALSTLKDEYQEALILYYLEKVSVPEIADILGKSENAVRVMIHRGVGKLREILKD